MTQHEIQHAPLQVQAVGEQVAKPRDDHVLHPRAGQRVFKCLRKVLEHNDGLRAAVFQLMRQFTHRIERIHVDHHGAGLERAKQRDRILERVGQHDRHTFAWLHADSLQIGRERIHLARQLAIREARADADVGDALAKLFRALVEELHDRFILPDVDFVRYLGRIRCVPDAIGIRRALRCRGRRSGHVRATGLRGGRLGRLVHRVSPEALSFVWLCVSMRANVR